ncbi:MAG: serine/threonine-protein kinase [Planctomycetota bacterium]
MNSDRPTSAEPPDEPDAAAVEELFDRILDLPPDERRQALEGSDVEADVRDRVSRLLGHFDDPPANLELGVVASEALDDFAASRWIGPYSILGMIGVGAMGVVYRAEQETPRREVALKLMRAAVAGPAGEQRFEREAQLLGRLQHPGIAQIFEYGIADLDEGRTAYIAMELVDGRPLSEYVEDRGIDLRGRVQLLVELCDAIHHAHLRGVLHRDLKPSNVLVTEAGRIKVIDFGVARPIDADQDAWQATLEGQVVGTLAYMSPEQVRGDLEILDARADVYSLGALAYELLSGRLPHALDGMTLLSAIQVVAERDVPRLGSVAPACRGDLDWIVGRALEKDPEQRFQSAEALARDFQRWLDFEAVEARPPSAVYQLRRFARRHLGAALAIGVTSVSLVVAAVVSAHFAIDNAQLAESEAEARARAEEEAGEADRLRRLAEANAAEVIRRTDPDRLDRAIREADTLWPTLPATAPAIHAWLAEFADPLLASLDAHRQTLRDWRRNALAYTEADRRSDRETWRFNDPSLQERQVSRSLRRSASV